MHDLLSDFNDYALLVSAYEMTQIVSGGG